MIERSGIIKFNNRDISIVGMDLEPGVDAPDFRVTNQDWDDISIMKATQGKIRIIASVLSLETSVCDRETRRFNQEAANLSKDISIIVISMDLPFTQAKWCGAAGLDQVSVVSDHKYTEFGMRYACLLSEPRILRRAVFIVDRKNIIRYAAYMPALGDEPDYGEVLRIAKSLL